MNVASVSKSLSWLEVKQRLYKQAFNMLIIRTNQIVELTPFQNIAKELSFS